MSPSQLAAIIPVLIVAMDVIWRFFRGKAKRKGLPLPPGPTPIPIIGNILSVNRRKPWETYTEWHAKYGDIIYHRLLDQDIIVLGSRSTAVQLLEKRSHLYSDRPFIATIESYGVNCMFVFTPYGDHWRSCRRMFHQTYRAVNAPNLRPTQLRMARQLLIDIVENPHCYSRHYNVFSVAVSSSGSYAYEPNGLTDPIVRTFENFAELVVPVATPEQAIFLKLFPFLLHVPDWLPGSSLKREAKRARDLSVKLTEMPYQHAEKHLETSDEPRRASMVSDHLVRMPRFMVPSQREKYVFDLKKAAVSSILGTPKQKLTRWWGETAFLILRTGLPCRMSTQSFVKLSDGSRWYLWGYGMLPRTVIHTAANTSLEASATVIANAWAMSRDKSRFPNADNFVPERFLDDEGMLDNNNPTDFIFGFGRRICPGRYAADATLYVAIATMLATLEFSIPKDAQGEDVAFSVKWVNGITRHPESFPCRITPRAHVNKSYLESARAGPDRSV